MRRAKRDRLKEQLRRLLPKLATADSEAATLLLRDDAVLHVPGHSQIAGEYRGRSAIIEFFEALSDLSDGTFRLEVADLSIESWSGDASLRATAKRQGDSLSVSERLRFEFTRGRIHDATIVPDDRRSHDAFWGPARRPLLTREDRETIAKVLSAQGGNGGRPGSVLGVLLVAFLAAWLLILGLQWLQHRRQPVGVTVTTERAADTKHFTLGGTSVEWNVPGSVFRSLTVLGPESGAVDIVLPLKPSEICEALRRLRRLENCASGQVLLETPVEIDWSRPMFGVSRRIYTGEQLDVALGVSDASNAVTVLARGNDTPSFCFSGAEGASLTLRQGTTTTAPITLTKADGLVDCESGFHLIAGNEGRSLPPTMVFGGTQALQLTASGTSAILQGLNGRITLGYGGSRVFSSQGQVVIAGSSRRRLTAIFRVDTAGSSLRVTSNGARSVLTDEGELVPSVWDRYPALIGPIFAGLVGVGVVAPLTVVFRRTTDRFSRLGLRRIWRGSIGGVTRIIKRLSGREG